MKVSGYSTNEMDKASRLTRMEASIVETSSIINHMVKVSTLGLQVRVMMVNSCKAAKMVSVFGRVFRTTVIWVSGATTRSGALVSING